jgi:hypothetical protein
MIMIALLRLPHSRRVFFVQRGSREAAGAAAVVAILATSESQRGQAPIF